MFNQNLKILSFLPVYHVMSGINIAAVFSQMIKIEENISDKL